MKIIIHQAIQRRQLYSCQCCGRGCRSFLVPVAKSQRDSIEKLADWREKLAVTELFIRSSAAGRYGYGLSKRPNGDCVFLDKDNLCLIHKQFGIQAKPLACQLFPFVFTPFNGAFQVGLRFDCPGVCESRGRELKSFLPELKNLARKLAPESAADVEPPKLYSKVEIKTPWFETINDTLLEIVNDESVEFVKRLHWLRLFARYLCRVKWKNVTDKDFPDLINLFKTGLKEELKNIQFSYRPATGKPRKLLGQIFFMLCHPSENVSNPKGGFFSQLKSRMASTDDLKQLGLTSGKLPQLQNHWPQCDMTELENSMGGWPAEVDDFLTRYLTCRIAGMNYCGPNFYNYSLVDGLRSLLLALTTVGWVMRIEAVKARRQQIELSDAHNAIITIDGNLGYGAALGMGPARLRLGYLTDHLEDFINCYCL